MIHEVYNDAYIYIQHFVAVKRRIMFPNHPSCGRWVEECFLRNLGLKRMLFAALGYTPETHLSINQPIDCLGS